MKSSRFAALVAAVAAQCIASARCGEAERPSPEVALSGVEKTARFEIRFRPGSRAEASVDRTAVLVEQELTRILERLEFRDFKHVIQLFLYDDVAELQKITGVSGAGGYSVPLAVHMPYDNDQTRLHELVHVVAEKLPEKGSESRSLFFAEGLANAVLEFVTGVHVDSVAAFYKKNGKLPSIEELHAIDDFYRWLGEHPNFNGYDVGGSWMLYLLDTYGAKKVRRYYAGVPATEAFARDLRQLEKGWHARLDQVVLRPGLEQLLRERHGESSAFTAFVDPTAKLTPELLGPDSEWKTIAIDKTERTGPGKFERDGKKLVGEGPEGNGDWTEAELSTGVLGDGMARVTARPIGTCWGIKLMFGHECQAMVLGNGAFLYNKVGGIAFDGNAKLGSDPIEIVLRRQSGRATVWIGGLRVLEGDVDASESPLGLGVVIGKATFEDLKFRALE